MIDIRILPNFREDITRIVQTRNVFSTEYEFQIAFKTWS